MAVAQSYPIFTNKYRYFDRDTGVFLQPGVSYLHILFIRLGSVHSEITYDFLAP